MRDRTLALSDALAGRSRHSRVGERNVRVVGVDFTDVNGEAHGYFAGAPTVVMMFSPRNGCRAPSNNVGTWIICGCLRV